MKATVGLMILLAVFAANAKITGKIAGTVWDADTGKPIEDANVTVMRTEAGSSTDPLGRYSIGPLPPGLYLLEASHIAYRPVRARIQISGGEIGQDFYLYPRTLEAEEVVITANRAVPGVTPVTFKDLPQAVLSREHTVEEVPMLLQNLVPGVYAYSDAGNGIGNTNLSIRGFNQKRINVMINGIPLNDPEDHQVYWYDMPDLTSSLQDIQVQRGVGTALVGQSGMGGSVNMLTTVLPGEPGMKVTGGIGSWATRKFSFEIGSVSSGERAMYARFSRILSDGYRDRTSSDMWSYFLAAQTAKENLLVRLNAYGGPIKTHAGWYAANEDSLKTNRRFNPVSYEDEIDSFNQPHYELHVVWDRSDRLTISNSLFYVRGRGYYQQYKYDKRLRDYGVAPVDDDSTTADLIRQKKVKKDHVGLLPRIDWGTGALEASVGGELSYYRGEHWGRLLDVLPVGAFPESAIGTYYKYRGEKLNLSGFIHSLTHLTDKIDLLADLSIQKKRYSFRQEEAGHFQEEGLNRFKDDFTFLSPRTGITIRPFPDIATYFNVSLAKREPADDDYFDVWDGPDDLFVDPLFADSDTVRNSDGNVEYIEWSDPQVNPEKLIDYEAGLQVNRGGLQAGIALYLMLFEDEIIPYGRFDHDRGAPVTGNAPKTEHKGVELDFSVPCLKLFKGELTLGFVASFSDNKLKEFTSYESWTEEGEDLSGNPIPLFPDKLMTFRAGYKLGMFRLHGQVRHVGKQYLDTSGDAHRVVDPYTVMNSSLSVGPVAIPGGGIANLEFRIENLIDKEYETSGYYDSWEGKRYYWVGAERTFYVGVRLDL